MMIKQTDLNRKRFLKQISAGALSLAIPEIVSAAFTGLDQGSRKIHLRQDDIILFQGDSITDADRFYNEKRYYVGRALGCGYVLLTAAELLKAHPSKNLRIFNRGVSGNKVHEMAARWEEDCIALKPNIISILIGVNDYWHRLIEKIKYQGTVKDYASNLRALLHKTRDQLPGADLIICEPFAMKGIKAVTDKWFPAFDEYRQTAQDIASEMNALFIPTQRILNKALEFAPGEYWCHDGVHLSMAGAKLVSEAWLKCVK